MNKEERTFGDHSPITVAGDAWVLRPRSEVLSSEKSVDSSHGNVTCSVSTSWEVTRITMNVIFVFRMLCLTQWGIKQIVAILQMRFRSWRFQNCEYNIIGKCCWMTNWPSNSALAHVIALYRSTLVYVIFRRHKWIRKNIRVLLTVHYCCKLISIRSRCRSVVIRHIG